MAACFGRTRVVVSVCVVLLCSDLQNLGRRLGACKMHSPSQLRWYGLLLILKGWFCFFGDFSLIFAPVLCFVFDFYTFLSVLSSFAVILSRKRELIALL